MLRNLTRGWLRRYVLKNLTRDWGAEGAPERSQSYGRIVREVAAVLGPPPRAPARPPRVLVPGAGLGRLCCDLAALGYEAQAREMGCRVQGVRQACSLVYLWPALCCQW